MWKTLEQWQSRAGLGNSPRTILEELGRIQSADVVLPLAEHPSHQLRIRCVVRPVGIQQFASPNCCTISKNTATNNRFFGIVIQDGNGTTRKNTITGGEVGIGVVADTVNTVGVLTDDKISGTTVAPIKEISCCGFTATATVK